MSSVIDQTTLAHLEQLFSTAFGASDAPAVAAFAPGRSEIAGNHTDHEGGRVIACALDVAAHAIARPRADTTVRLASEGYPTFELDLSSAEAREDERGTTASLVRGMAHEVAAATGATPRGFDLAMWCDIPSGGGLSSSAAVEALLGRTMEALWGAQTGAQTANPVALAQMCQRTENNYYGKPCGLMDQAAVCLGGLALMDFANAHEPATKKLDLVFEDFGYALVLVKVGADHAASTADYAAIPGEMQAIAADLGHGRLCEVSREAFDEALPELRRKHGDRAILRCIHYWHEDALVQKRWQALNIGDVATFLELTRESGASSAMYLQNVAAELGREQPAMLALGAAEHLLRGDGAARIHGGGFGGTIQAFVPLEQLDAFCAQMDAWLGAGSCRRYTVSSEGASAACLK